MRCFLTILICALTALTARADEATADQVLAEMNLARTQPQAYAQIVAEAIPRQRTAAGRSAAREAVRLLEQMKPVLPLRDSSGLSAAAALHVADTGPRGARGHRGSRASSPWDRIDRFGRRSGTAAENICYGPRNARSMVVMQLIDAGVWSRGHRKNILSPSFAQAGVACGPHAEFGSMCVIDFAAHFVENTPTGRALAAR